MIEVKALWKKFGRLDALRGLRFNVPQGSAYALIGANGAGKTTTIKVLMNIIGPTRGSATVFGRDSRKISPRELRRIGYVSENQDMPEKLTVSEYLAAGRPHRFPFVSRAPANQRTEPRPVWLRRVCVICRSRSECVLFPARFMPPVVNLPFRDSAGLAHFPVEGSKLREARAVLQLYRAQDHFMRTVVIPEIRLVDWEARAPGA